MARDDNLLEAIEKAVMASGNVSAHTASNTVRLLMQDSKLTEFNLKDDHVVIHSESFFRQEGETHECVH